MPLDPEDLRENELTAVLNRNLFDLVPGHVTDPADIARWKQFRINYNKASNLQDFDFPLQIDFELSSQCNMKCSFCLHGAENVPRAELAFESFKKIIDEGEKYGLCSIKMNVINEPLLCKEMPKFIEYARAHGVLNVYFATNGSLMNKRWAEELIRVKVSKVMISLDAVTPETFWKMRNSKHLEKIVKNIKYLIALRKFRQVSYPLIRVNFLETDLNSHEAQDFIDYWSDKVDMIGFQERVGVPGVDDPMEHDKKDFKCSFPFKQVAISAAGQIMPCCTFNGRDIPIGNISRNTIKEAWDSAKMRHLKDVQRRGEYRQIRACKHCIDGSGCA